MNKRRMMRKALVLVLAASGLSIVGCGRPDDTSTTTTTVAATPPVPEFKPDVDAGWPVQVVNDPDAVKKLAQAKLFIARNDPFALLRNEQAFEASQRAESFLGQVGGWTMLYEPPPPPTGAEDEQTAEPQPYRRLSGIIVGDTVQAIIEMENGRVEIVRPGMRIPNSEWRVISIDQDKAVLRRAGRRRPTEIIVRLESPPAGMGGGGAPTPGPGFGPGGDGRPGGGRPGMPGPGPQGGPGGPGDLGG